MVSMKFNTPIDETYIVNDPFSITLKTYIHLNFKATPYTMNMCFTYPFIDHK